MPSFCLRTLTFNFCKPKKWVFKDLIPMESPPGIGNSALGFKSLESFVSGQNNVAVGNNSLNSLSVGNYNTAIGSEALMKCNANGNTAVGNAALTNDTSGVHNTAVGSGAGKGFAGDYAASHNVLLGFQAGYYITTGADNNILIGYYHTI